jgi:putative ABC transport system substrate-binding protein
MAIHVQRREFIVTLGGAVAWPLAARAQQPVIPTIGFLNSASHGLFESRVRAFRQGLSEGGYVEGQNVRIEYRWADGYYEQFPALVAELVRLQVSLIVANTLAAEAAKAVTTTIPIVFVTAIDPVESGLVSSLNRPGGNLTGISNLNVQLGAKRLELIRELAPTTSVIALLVNPANLAAQAEIKAIQAAARALAVQIHILYASTDRDFDSAFATLIHQGMSALVIATDPFFTSHSEQLAALTVRHAVPTIYQFREFAVAGGLMSYGGSSSDQYRQMGVYAARILKGEKPADLPVQQSSKVELIINLKTARALGITFPLTLLGRADEVIE